MRRFRSRLRDAIRSIRSGWGVCQADWRGEWQPGIQNVADVLRDALADAQRQLAASDTVAPLRHGPFLAAMLAHMDLPAIAAQLDVLFEMAETPAGLQEIERAFEAMLAPFVKDASATEFLTAFQVACVVVLYGAILQHGGAEALWVKRMTATVPPDAAGERVH